LSSISIVAFTTVCTNIVGKKLKTDAIKSI
jgi:hypothetical protein